MTDPEYVQLRKHLEEQRRIGMELVERAYEALPDKVPCDSGPKLFIVFT